MTDPIRLMEYYDGELEPEDAARFELELDGDALERLAGLEQVGAVVRALAEHEEEGRSVRINAIADRVMARLDEPSLVSGMRALRDHATPEPARRRRAAKSSRLNGALAAGAGLLALAAGVCLVWVPDLTRGLGGVSEGAGPTSARRDQLAVNTQPPASVVPEIVVQGPGVSIEMVDFGTQNGTIFMVTSREGGSTPVVWLADEGSEAQDRVEL